jgi:hypothetical protein
LRSRRRLGDLPQQTLDAHGAVMRRRPAGAKAGLDEVRAQRVEPWRRQRGLESGGAG